MLLRSLQLDAVLVIKAENTTGEFLFCDMVRFFCVKISKVWAMLDTPPLSKHAEKRALGEAG